MIKDFRGPRVNIKLNPTQVIKAAEAFRKKIQKAKEVKTMKTDVKSLINKYRSIKDKGSKEARAIRAKVRAAGGSVKTSKKETSKKK